MQTTKSMRHSVLLTRHINAAKKTESSLAHHGYNSFILPLSQIKLLDNLPPGGKFDLLIFTSPIAPQLLRQQIIRDDDYHLFLQLPIFCVGELTAKCAAETGFSNTIEFAPTAKSLAELLIKSDPGTRILYPCAKERSFDMVVCLEQRKITCNNWEIYANQLIDADNPRLNQALEETDTIFLFSKRSADHFFKIINNRPSPDNYYKSLSRLNFVTISEQVASSIPEPLRSKTHIAKHPNEASMIECLQQI